MQDSFQLKVRGTVAFVGTHKQCFDQLFERWGWVPMKVFEAVVRPEIVPVKKKASA